MGKSFQGAEVSTILSRHSPELWCGISIAIIADLMNLEAHTLLAEYDCSMQ